MYAGAGRRRASTSGPTAATSRPTAAVRLGRSGPARCGTAAVVVVPISAAAAVVPVSAAAQSTLRFASQCPRRQQLQQQMQQAAAQEQAHTPFPSVWP